MQLDQEQIEKDLPLYSSEKLADMVIAHRYLGLFKETCVMAMQELARRREAGDDFNYEEYIENNSATLPKLNLGPHSNNLTEMLQNLKGMINDFKF